MRVRPLGGTPRTTACHPRADGAPGRRDAGRRRPRGRACEPRGPEPPRRIDQCEAARDIREAFGPEEKFLNFLEASDEDAAFAAASTRLLTRIGLGATIAQHCPMREVSLVPERPLREVIVPAAEDRSTEVQAGEHLIDTSTFKLHRLPTSRPSRATTPEGSCLPIRPARGHHPSPRGRTGS